MTTQKPKPPTKEKAPRDWALIGLVICILYLVLLLPFAAVVGAKPEILGGAIGALTTALVTIIATRAARG